MLLPTAHRGRRQSAGHWRWAAAVRTLEIAPVRTVGEAVYEQMGVGSGILVFNDHVTLDNRLRVGSTRLMSGMWQRDMPSGFAEVDAARPTPTT